MRRAVVMASRCVRYGGLGGLAAVWQNAASEVETFVRQAAPAVPPMPTYPTAAYPRTIASTAAASSSSEPQRAEDEEPAPYRHCWQCGSGLQQQDMFFCPDCRSIQPPETDAEAKYFRVFGMEQPRFDLDQEELERRYKQLQRLLHPDKFSVGSPLEKEYSDQQAALVNQAYDVLKKPLRRAHYMLQQRGLGACEGLTITDPELLMYVMEAREEVEATIDPDRLRELLEESQAQEARCIQELEKSFRKFDFAHAAEVTTQLRYVKRIQEAIIDKL